MSDTLKSIIMLVLSLAVGVFGLIINRNVSKRYKESEDKPHKLKKQKTWSMLLTAVMFWIASGNLITLIFGKPKSEGLQVSIFAERIKLFGLDISTTVITTWVIMAILIIAALIIRIFVIPKFKETPKGFQNLLETFVEYASGYTNSKTNKIGDNLGAYIFSIGVMMLGAAFVELLGVRSPTSDLTFTVALALITFILINYYGIKRKGIIGRVKSLGQPSPIIFPFKILSDIAVPISLSCRLFGNMLGSMIVVDLIYVALGNNAIGIPSVLGLYFNAFDPLIQAFIFITLTLTFIDEATE